MFFLGRYSYNRPLVAMVWGGFDCKIYYLTMLYSKDKSGWTRWEFYSLTRWISYGSTTCIENTCFQVHLIAPQHSESFIFAEWTALRYSWKPLMFFFVMGVAQVIIQVMDPHGARERKLWWRLGDPLGEAEIQLTQKLLPTFILDIIHH